MPFTASERRRENSLAAPTASAGIWTFFFLYLLLCFGGFVSREVSPRNSSLIQTLTHTHETRSIRKNGNKKEVRLPLLLSCSFSHSLLLIETRNPPQKEADMECLCDVMYVGLCICVCVCAIALRQPPAEQDPSSSHSKRKQTPIPSSRAH